MNNQIPLGVDLGAHILIIMNYYYLFYNEATETYD